MFVQIVISMLLASSAGISTTPSPAEWTRKIMLGFNETEIVYLEIKRNAPGNYYRYVDSSFVVSRDPASRQFINRQPIRATWHEDSTSEGDWTMKELYAGTLDLNGYMSDKKLHYAYNTTRPSIGQLRFENYGLVLYHNEVGILLLSRERIAEQSSEFLEMMSYEEARIVAKHNSRNHLLLTVQIGMDNMDSDFKQFILAAPMKDLSEAEQTFRKLNR